MTAVVEWDEQYARSMGLRWYPSEALCQFVGRVYGTGPGVVHDVEALEIGCGNGANVWFLAKHCRAVTGVDGSPTALQLAADRLRADGLSATLKACDALDLPFPDSSFDLVVDVQCVQHIKFSDHERAFREIARVLRPGGWFFSKHLGTGTHRYAELFPTTGHVAIVSARWLAAKLERARLTPGTVTSETRTYPGGAAAQWWIVNAQKADGRQRADGTSD